MPNKSPSMQAPIVMSNPALMVVSDPSIRAVKRHSKVTRILLFVLVAVSLLALTATILIMIRQTNENKIQVQKEEAIALEIKHVNAQPIRDLDDEELVPAAEEEDSFIYFNLSTNPDGADVYLDNLYIGTTDAGKSLEKKLPKSDKKADILISLDGYRIARQSFAMNSDFSDTIALDLIPVVQPHRAAAVEKAPPKAVTANKAMIIPARTAVPKDPDNKKASKRSKQSAKQPAKAPVMDIVLPD